MRIDLDEVERLILEGEDVLLSEYTGLIRELRTARGIIERARRHADADPELADALAEYDRRHS